MKKIAIAIGVIVLALFAFGSLAEAQTAPVIDHWKTAEECLAAQNAPFYYPTILSERKLGKGERIWGHQTGGCFEMDLPDRIAKRGFVRIEAGRRFVYDGTTGKLLRLAECNNDVYSVEPFPPLKVAQGIQGNSGAVGPQGPKGDKGDKGDVGSMGPAGRDGSNGQDGKNGYTPVKGVDYFDGKNGTNAKNGFCSSMKCKVAVAAIIAGAGAGGYAIYNSRAGSSATATASVVIKLR